MPSTIGSRIKRLRKEAGLTLKGLAKKSGLNYSQISKMETERYELPSVDRVRRLARALDVTVDELVLGVAGAHHEKVRVADAAMVKAAKERAGEL